MSHQHDTLALVQMASRGLSWYLGDAETRDRYLSLHAVPEGSSMASLRARLAEILELGATMREGGVDSDPIVAASRLQYGQRVLMAAIDANGTLESWRALLAASEAVWELDDFFGGDEVEP
jgi:hypothetical protein